MCTIWKMKFNKGNAKRGVSPRQNNWPGDLDFDLENQ
jgi:hypothetical protein